METKIRTMKIEEEDRINALADDVLYHILSFIDTQTLLKTVSFVSKKWKTLWLSTPTLVFHYPSSSCPHSNGPEIGFRRFVQHVLTHRHLHSPSPNLNNLTLSFVTHPLGSRRKSQELWDSRKFKSKDTLFFKTLFCLLAEFNLQSLTIHGGYIDFSTWPSQFSSCRSITLFGFFDGYWVPHSFQFLKSFEIQNFYASVYLKLDGDVFPTYPLLERLILGGPCFERAKISAPRLEYLEMESRTYWNDRFTPQLFLSTPNLSFITLSNIAPSLVSADDFLTLQKLEFSFTFNVSIHDDETKQRVVKRMRGLFTLLQKPNSLTINSLALQLLSEFIIPSTIKEEAIKFQKLRHLMLKGSITMPNHILRCLLNSPSLEKLN